MRFLLSKFPTGDFLSLYPEEDDDELGRKKGRQDSRAQEELAEDNSSEIITKKIEDTPRQVQYKEKEDLQKERTDQMNAGRADTAWAMSFFSAT